MLRKYWIVVFVLINCFFVCNAWGAEQDSANQFAERIQKRYEKIKTFQAEFTQELTNVASGEVDKRKGQIWFKQPSQVRWETLEPEKELLVVGPEFAWDYIADEELALKYDVATLFNSKTILRFISGQARLNDDFIVKTDWQGSEAVKTRWGKGCIVLQLIPKEAEPGLVMAYIGVEPDTGILRKVMIVDFYGNGNEVQLNDIKLNIDFPTSMFSFFPPEGTTIEDNTQGF
ncbi:LolA family protein [Pseudodesulfovibrio piezophilus]|uniref:Outer membrane lipoprotein carrier protein LolA n=1 Tax=Pseudodesulfovibrio piezophilus (strain DSM 21447 / JCM 15486 / C1TLV30) TaxID=1322246 RepID=M1WQF6_PSEP2|nr:outer membrane lipoprotein carrier protein LolA [Pseudodesulfovibrio piezophilus]CCH47677.1 Outer membrane lipoprotein carrier protein LolA [Pseudodesulfovibrio piezophilus C1TLV30]